MNMWVQHILIIPTVQMRKTLVVRGVEKDCKSGLIIHTQVWDRKGNLHNNF